VAAAVLGDANKVKFTPLSAKERFTALTSGEIDILSIKTFSFFFIINKL
jgi:general L-amino acid transport system substrate-binding protein